MPDSPVDDPTSAVLPPCSDHPVKAVFLTDFPDVAGEGQERCPVRDHRSARVIFAAQTFHEVIRPDGPASRIPWNRERFRVAFLERFFIAQSELMSSGDELGRNGAPPFDQ